MTSFSEKDDDLDLIFNKKNFGYTQEFIKNSLAKRKKAFKRNEYKHSIHKDIRIEKLKIKICNALKVNISDFNSNKIRTANVVLARNAVSYWAIRKYHYKYDHLSYFLKMHHSTLMIHVKNYPIKRKKMGRFLKNLNVKD